MVGTSLKEKTLVLIELCTRMEIEMNAIISRLCAPEGPRLSKNLLDAEGFPREDIDIPSIQGEQQRLAVGCNFMGTTKVTLVKTWKDEQVALCFDGRQSKAANSYKYLEMKMSSTYKWQWLQIFPNHTQISRFMVLEFIDTGFHAFVLADYWILLR